MQIERLKDIALLRINTGKANAINREWLASFNRVLHEIGDVRALVITGYESFFSAGLDLPSLLELDAGAMKVFIQSFNTTMLRLFSVPIPVVAAVNGHAVAGGCVLAMQADYRFMADGKFKIGLNEVPLGIGLPLVVMETLRAQVPVASILPIALEGRLFAPGDARAVGLVHEVVPPSVLMGCALARAEELAALPTAAAQQVKRAIRRPVIERIEAGENGDAARWVDTWFSEGGQRLIREAVARLKGGKA